MSWDAVLPIITLVLGYPGSHYSDRWREKGERERARLNRIASVETDALVELQDILTRLPAVEIELTVVVNEAIENETSTFDAFTQFGPDRFMSNRAWALATRITDDHARKTVMDALQVIIDNPFEGMDRIDRGEPTEIRWADRWHASTRALIVIGERLRAPGERS